MFGIVMLAVAFQFQLRNNIPSQWDNLDSEAASSLLTGIKEHSPFISSVIAVNAPQLYLSFWYLAYNSLLTRLEMSREWALFYDHYRPLRVTRPRGKQIATSRLQLPYKYSISLMALSGLMHWLMSSVLFVMVSRGDYFPPEYDFARDVISLPEDATVVVGTLSLPVLILIILGSLMTLSPIALSRRNLPGCMPIVGSNSLAIMAACRVSPSAKIPTSDNSENTSIDQEDTELEDLVPESSRSISNEHEISNADTNKNIALHLLKWGEIKMPDEWYRLNEWRCRMEEDFQPLGFGTTLDEPQTPIEGCWYM
ncbi:hypothetical protein CGCS363_v002445 [Colletotrichum siamense]|uniref:uncharacterized protein n=1 Tax=Colletotrichum siamense TaxID=690259 RepID=UPI001873017E|nr:uncharacterized protein CGCS363_v002445 [Colletotrichum siamense]KAF5509989.1 hypothetical protein CGCS363_v002445 [Colletotrichum siamense]